MALDEFGHFQCEESLLFVDIRVVLLCNHSAHSFILQLGTQRANFVLEFSEQNTN